MCLFHGFGNQAHIWDLFAPVLAGRYHVYAFDSRGHGDTDYASEYGADFNAADAVALIDGLDLQRLSLIGFSMGGITAIHVASDHPERIESLVLVDVGPEVNPAGARGMRATVAQAQSRFAGREEALAYVRLANPRRSEEFVQASLTHAFREHPDGSFELKYDQRLRQGMGRRPRPAEELWGPRATDNLSDTDRARRGIQPVHGADRAAHD